MDLTCAVWRKSSYSGNGGNTCVEVATPPAGDRERLVAVRDSEDPEGPKLVFTATQWRDFTAAVKTGIFGR